MSETQQPMPTTSAALDAAKIAYQDKLRSTWANLHDDAEADFEAGHAAAATGQPWKVAQARFAELIDGHPMADLRLEDFKGGFDSFLALADAA